MPVRGTYPQRRPRNQICPRQVPARDAGYPKRTTASETGRNTVQDTGQAQEKAKEVAGQAQEKVQGAAEQAAERVQSAGQWLEQKNGDELLRDVEDFARRNPWAVAAGGLVLGLAASRLLKASSTERYRASQPNGSGTYGRTGTPIGAGTLASEPMPPGAADEFGGGEFSRQEGSMISTEPRT